MPRKTFKRSFKRKSRIPKKYYSRTKRMVTGHPPTMLENISTGVGHVASLARAVLPAIMAINTEEKYSDKTATVNSYTPGTNDSIIALTDQVAQGLGDNDRIGNSILARGLQIRLAQNFTSSTTVLGLYCRMLLVCWKENAQINQISAAKLFEVPNNLYSPLNKDYSDQFVVMKDKFFTLNAGNGGLAVGQAFTSSKIFKNINWHIRYDGSLGGNATQNHIYLILRSSATGTTNSLATTYYSRLTYTDN